MLRRIQSLIGESVMEEQITEKEGYKIHNTMPFEVDVEVMLSEAGDAFVALKTKRRRIKALLCGLLNHRWDYVTVETPCGVYRGAICKFCRTVK